MLYCSHQTDQHGLDIQKKFLFLQILLPDRGVPRHKAARRLARISGCGKSLPADFLKPPPRRPRVRLVRQDLLRGEVVALTLVIRVQISGRELEGDGTSAGVWCSGTKLGMVAVQDLVIPHTNRIHILPDLPHDYPQDACRCLDRTSLWCRSTHTVSWRAYFWTFPYLKYLAFFSCSS